MSEEITVSAKLQCVNGMVDEKDDDASFTVDQITMSAAYPGFRRIGTSEEAVTFTELTSMGYCKLKNLDPTNFIDFGFSTAVYGIRLLSGESAVFRFVPGTTLYAKADTAEVPCLIRCYDA